MGPDGNGDSPSAIDFAASCGRVEAFSFLVEKLGADQDSDWFGLRQVCAFTDRDTRLFEWANGI